MEVILQQIGKSYESWIFRGINAEFKTNTINAIKGRNGSGKSTLLQIISGFITPTEGKVKHLINATETEAEEVPLRISISAPYLDLPEEFTVKEIIEMHRNFKRYRKELTVDQILEKTMLLEHQGKMLSKLSSGMKQRLKLALAIYSDSSLLLLDEPCSNLDPSWMDWFNRELCYHSDNRTVIVCTNSNTAELQSVKDVVIDVSEFTP